MYAGGGLVGLGVVVIGIVEMALGAPHPVSGEGQIEHGTLIPVWIRSSIILGGLLVWGLTAIYKVVVPAPAGEEAGDAQKQAADRTPPARVAFPDSRRSGGRGGPIAFPTAVASTEYPTADGRVTRTQPPGVDRPGLCPATECQPRYPAW